MSPLTDMMKRQGFFFRVEELTHGNQKKTDRIMWALQGRFEHGLIQIKRAEWNSRLLDELFQFPDPLTHDDLVDSSTQALLRFRQGGFLRLVTDEEDEPVYTRKAEYD